MLDAADPVLWLDLPTRIWLPRLARRSARRMTGRPVVRLRSPAEVERWLANFGIEGGGFGRLCRLPRE